MQYGLHYNSSVDVESICYDYLLIHIRTALIIFQLALNKTPLTFALFLFQSLVLLFF